MANIPIPENDDSLELNVRYQPDMVLEGMLDATVPEFTRLTLTMGDETYDMLGARSGDEILELLSEDLTAAEEGKVLTVVEDDSGDTPVYNAEWADIPDQLPTISAGDAGKVLSVNAGETGTEWADAPSGLPAITNADEGKVLTVVEDDSGDTPVYQAEWVTPSEVLSFSTALETEAYGHLSTQIGTLIMSGSTYYDNAWTLSNATAEDVAKLEAFVTNGLAGKSGVISLLSNIFHPVLFSGSAVTIMIPRFVQAVPNADDHVLQIVITLATSSDSVNFTLQLFDFHTLST